jgi:hypothetical protein
LFAGFLGSPGDKRANSGRDEVNRHRSLYEWLVTAVVAAVEPWRLRCLAGDGETAQCHWQARGWLTCWLLRWLMR